MLERNESVLMKIQHNDKVGRYAVTSCDLNPGDVIFSESPFAFGPKADSPPLCLGCCSPVDGSTFCSSCNWPVCDAKCEQIPAHRDAECSVFARARVRFQPVEDFTAPCMQYECITPLRVLLAKELNPERWDQEVEKMESHNAVRKNKPIWRFNQINIVNYLRGPCQLEDTFDEELIHKVCGILECNAFEARSFSGHPVRCLFPKLAILSHNCISNITYSVVSTGLGDNEDFRVTVRAATKIQEDEECFSSYTYSLWPTVKRREHLKESKYFDCSCDRCLDPTEMGTHLSTIKCNKCDDGLVMSTNPLDKDAKWQCSYCGDFKESAYIRIVFETIQDQVDAVDNFQGESRAQLLEMLLQNYEGVLHPQNAYCCTLLSSLIHTYGRLEGRLIKDCSGSVLEKKVQVCRQVLQILDVVEPGYTRIRGVTLYELYTALALLLENQKVDKPDLRSQLQEIVNVLEESATILKLEPASTPEGKIGILAINSLSLLKAHFENIAERKLNVTDMMFSNTGTSEH